MLTQPLLHRGELVHGVVVSNQVARFAPGRCAVDPIQEFQPLSMRRDFDAFDQVGFENVRLPNAPYPRIAHTQFVRQRVRALIRGRRWQRLSHAAQFQPPFLTLGGRPLRMREL